MTTRAVIVAGVLGGAALRIWAVLLPQGALDADEAVVGLLTRGILHGTFPVFFPGQGYGGTQEEFLAAPLVAGFGLRVWAIRIVVVVLWAVAAVLVWRIGLRVLDERRAVLAALLFWLWPTYFAWKSTRAHGFYGSELVLALVVLLVVLRLDARVTRLDLVALGLALGCGLWSSPQVAIVALPALAWLVWRRRGLVRHAPLVLAAAVVGALPWLLGNLRHDWYSLHPGANEGTWTYHLHNLVVATLPEALGLRLAWSFEWLGGAVVGYAIYAAVVAGFVWLCVRRPARLAPLVLIVAVFPVFYFVSPYTWLQSEPRYLTLVMPVFALLVAYALTSKWRIVGVFAVALALTVGGFVELDRHDVVAFRTEGVAVPRDLSPVLRTLRAHRLGYAYASYWIAWRITFETDTRVVGAKASYAHPQVRAGRVVPGDPHDDLGIDPKPYLAAERHRDVAHVFVRGGDVEPNVAPVLRRAGYTRIVSGGFDVWVPPAA
ncbi:MAG TPA: glycosyltransferase family 39 protein [Gaiellaceae bacterium]|nr:glycosyltransferase family 39 protein [Gaiellaceae bacterium]